MSLARQAIASSSKAVLRTAQTGQAPLCLACLRSTLPSSAARHGRRFQSTETAAYTGTPEAHLSAQNLTPPRLPSSSNVKADVESIDISEDGAEPESSTSGPTLADLNALKPRRIRIPKETDLTNTTEFAIYQRKFTATLARVDKAFNKEQLIGLARKMRMSKTDNKLGKRRLIRRIVTEIWELPDPAERVAKEKELENTKIKQTEKAEEAIALKEKELFSLLGKMDGRELLHRLTSQNNVKASVRGAPPGTLHVTGAPGDVAKFLQDWEDVKADMRTVELETGNSNGLRSDLYKPLSMATETFVAPAPTASKVEVTFRAASYRPSERVQEMLRRLAIHESLQKSISRSAMLPTEDIASYTALSYIPRETSSWQHSSLPLYGLTRLSALDDIGGQDKQLRPTKAGQRDVKEVFEAAFPDTDGVTIHARFGHHLSIWPEARQTALESGSFDKLLDKQASSLSTFLPNAPAGILDSFHARSSNWPLDAGVQADTRVSSTSIRRLLYLPKDLASPSRFIRLERDTPGPKELAKEAEENAENAWTAIAGTQALADVYMPASSIDIRLAAEKSDVVAGDLLLPFADVSRGAAPDSLMHEERGYFLYEDHNIRKTVFEAIALPWADLSTTDLVMERRTDRLNGGAKTIAVEMSSKDGLAGYDALMTNLLRV